VSKEADALVERLRERGLYAAAFMRNGVSSIFAGNTDQDSEEVFAVDEDNPGRVWMRGVKLGSTKAIRPRTVDKPAPTVLDERCDAIAKTWKEHAANRAAQFRAWAVVNRLRERGLSCIATGGKVRITLELSPEYAAEVGPKIAAVMSEKAK